MHPDKPPLLDSLTPLTRIIFSILLIIASFTLLFFNGILLAGPIFGVKFNAVLTSLADYDNPRTMNLLRYLQVLQSVGLFVVPSLLAGYLFAGSGTRFLGFQKARKPLVYLLVLTLMFIALPFINWMVTVNEMMKLPESLKGIEDWMKATETEAANLTGAFIKMDSIGLFLFNLLMIGVLPAIGEEMLFRGLLQRLLRDWFGNIHVAIFMAAFFFSAMHMQFYGFFPRMMLGVIFGYLFYWSGSLWVPIWAHFINNGSVIIFAWLAQHGVIKGDYESFGSSDNLFVILFSAVILGMVLFIIRRIYNTTT